MYQKNKQMLDDYLLNDYTIPVDVVRLVAEAIYYFSKYILAAVFFQILLGNIITK